MVKSATMRYRINKLVERLEKGWNFIEEHPDRQDAREKWRNLVSEYESLSDQLSLLDQALEAYCNQRKGEPEQITRQLQKVLSQKEAELAQHKSDLSSPYYVEDDWTKSLIACLKSQITEVKRCLIKGGSLPACPDVARIQVTFAL
jgi:chromosome segregation ATPase